MTYSLIIAPLLLGHPPPRLRAHPVPRDGLDTCFAGRGVGCGDHAGGMNPSTHSRQEPAMSVRLKRLHDQVMVITGASSGIGLVTAREAARRGARLVLAARSGDELRQLAEEIRARR